MSLTTYQRYLKDRYFGEDVTIKKGKLHFRGYRISCTKENGFMVEDTTKKYKVVDTPFEGIPTLAELGDFLKLQELNIHLRNLLLPLSVVRKPRNPRRKLKRKSWLKRKKNRTLTFYVRKF